MITDARPASLRIAIALRQESANYALVEISDTDRVSLAEYFGCFPSDFRRGVEVGTERGEYAQTLIDHNSMLQLTCVDPWLAYKHYRDHVTQSKIDGFYDEVVERFKYKARVHLVRELSTVGARDFKDESLDFVYLDGNHRYEYVVADLAAWHPKLRVGGIMCGHDYTRRQTPSYYWCHVPEALNGWCLSWEIAPLFVLGRKDVIDGEKRDRPRSWMYIKRRRGI